MRFALPAAVGLAAAVAVAGCSAADAERVRDSADAVSDGISRREACDTTDAALDTIGSAAQRLADNPDLRVELAPALTSAVQDLVSQVSDIPEWTPVVEAAGTLASSMREANAATVRLTATEAVLAVRLAQAGCALAGPG